MVIAKAITITSTTGTTTNIRGTIAAITTIIADNSPALSLTLPGF
jgi:hypothetical protein